MACHYNVLRYHSLPSTSPRIKFHCSFKLFSSKWKDEISWKITKTQFTVVKMTYVHRVTPRQMVYYLESKASRMAKSFLQVYSCSFINVVSWFNNVHGYFWFSVVNDDCEYFGHFFLHVLAMPVKYCNMLDYRTCLHK